MDFQNELKRFGKFAFIITPMVVEVLRANPDEVADLDEFSNNSDGEAQAFVKTLNSDAEALYQEMMIDIVGDLIDLGYLE